MMENEEGVKLLKETWEEAEDLICLFFDDGFDGICFESQEDGTRRYLTHEDFLRMMKGIKEKRNEIWEKYGTFDTEGECISMVYGSN